MEKLEKLAHHWTQGVCGGVTVQQSFGYPFCNPPVAGCTDDDELSEGLSDVQTQRVVCSMYTGKHWPGRAGSAVWWRINAGRAGQGNCSAIETELKTG